MRLGTELEVTVAGRGFYGGAVNEAAGKALVIRY